MSALHAIPAIESTLNPRHPILNKRLVRCLPERCVSFPALIRRHTMASEGMGWLQ